MSVEGHRGRLVIAPSPDHVERAFNPAKYGEFSPEPVMEITLPSLADPSLAPDGACVLSADVQYAPYALKEGWETGKPKFLKAIMAVLERYAPGIGKSVRHAELLTPADIETRYPHAGRPLAPRRIAGRPDADVAAGLRRGGLRHADRAACSSAAPARIRAAASPACPASTPHGASSR